MATLSVLPVSVDKSLIRKGSATGPETANNNPGEPGRPLCRQRKVCATQMAEGIVRVCGCQAAARGHFFFGAIIITI
ncbi:hypothetical protein [Lysobacter sp. A03]|uniref:hypothetical protein n=1 Tax=Lysobacter sp. A03 TaxID=1199154 RepID=UPI00126A2C8D|nr:hypothetical protein [Lysobacter sp. A03]